jgi:type III pantothenate kinase
MSLIYLFDIGNTSGKFWRLSQGEVEEKAVLKHGGDMESLISQLPPSFNESPAEICGLMVLGTHVSQEFTALCKEKWSKLPRFAVSQSQFGKIKNGYDSSAALGVDRWVGLIGAGSHKESICVVSCGTALTIDVLKYGLHEGGYILPGLSLMGQCLRSHTAGVRFDGQYDGDLRLGCNTAEAVLNGALIALVSVIERVAADHAASEVVLTGGDASKVSAFLRLPHVIEPDLILTGLRKYFEK